MSVSNPGRGELASAHSGPVSPVSNDMVLKPSEELHMSGNESGMNGKGDIRIIDTAPRVQCIGNHSFQCIKRNGFTFRILCSGRIDSELDIDRAGIC